MLAAWYMKEALSLSRGNWESSTFVEAKNHTRECWIVFLTFLKFCWDYCAKIWSRVVVWKFHYDFVLEIFYIPLILSGNFWFSMILWLIFYWWRSVWVFGVLFEKGEGWQWPCKGKVGENAWGTFYRVQRGVLSSFKDWKSSSWIQRIRKHAESSRQRGALGDRVAALSGFVFLSTRYCLESNYYFFQV